MTTGRARFARPVFFICRLRRLVPVGIRPLISIPGQSENVSLSNRPQAGGPSRHADEYEPVSLPRTHVDRLRFAVAMTQATFPSGRTRI